MCYERKAIAFNFIAILIFTFLYFKKYGRKIKNKSDCLFKPLKHTFMTLTHEQKDTIKKKFKVRRSKKQHFFIPSENDVLTDSEYDLYHPFYSKIKAMRDGYIIPFVPYFDL